MSEVVLDSAIPLPLRRERTVAPKNPNTQFQPAYPSYSALFPPSMKEVAVAVIGSQRRAETNSVPSQLPVVIGFLEHDGESRVRYWEPATVIDASNALNEVVIAYWPSRTLYEAWAVDSGFQSWWTGLSPSSQAPCGWFLELFFPPFERFETISSENNVPDGAANMRVDVSGQIREHGYFGAMRDRLPLAQTDLLVGQKFERALDATSARLSSMNRRIIVPGKENLAVINSGQDWSGTIPRERELYLKTMHPVLIKGMNYLRDQGEQVGCYSCRFMDVLGTKSLAKGTERTFGLAYFDDLASLEKWSKEHKTHLDIFGGFMRYAKELGGNLSLRLYHEVSVLRPDQQYFEYIGCHEKTGMLASVNSVDL